MIYCPYCGSNLIQREMDNDITCLACSRTLSAVPIGLPRVNSQQLSRVGKGQNPRGAGGRWVEGSAARRAG